MGKIKSTSSLDECRKLCNLISKHYGKEHCFSKAAMLGIFPHFSHLANGVKLAVEFAMQHRKICFVVCNQIAKICEKGISFNLSFLVGNILDIVLEQYADENLIEMLSILQKQLKYGVSSLSQITLCEKAFYDRLIVKEIAEILGEDEIGGDDIIDYLKSKKQTIRQMLEKYPSYFTMRFDSITE